MRQTIVLLADHVPGLLARVESLFRRQSLPLERVVLAGDGASCRLTLTADVPPEKRALLVKHLRRLIDVKGVLETDDAAGATTAP